MIIQSLFLFITFLFSFCMDAMAQVPPPLGPITAAAPIDGVSTVLIAAGVGYASRRIYKYRNGK
jgi:hypothetical protein